MAFTTRTVTGSWPRGDIATKARGEIWFTPNARLVSAAENAVIPMTPIRRTLDNNGTISAPLICTDNAGINPVGWAWTVVERINGAPVKVYDIPVVAGAGSIDLADITPYEPAPALVQYILAATLTTKGDLLARSASGLDRLPVGSNSQVLTADSAQTLGMKWAAGGGGSGTPADTVAAETSYGVSANAGAAVEYSRGDHTHGTPALGTTGTTAAAGNHAHAGVYDPAGTAAAGDAAHVAAGDPHTQYAQESALGDAAGKNTGTTAGTVAAGDDGRITGAAQKAQNLADLPSASTARTNLGLGTAATTNTGTGAGNTILGNDARLTDSRTPTAHAASHADGGSDEITVDQSQVTGLTAALAAKLAASANLSDVANAATARTNLDVPPNSRQVIAGTGLTGGGSLAADRTLAVAYGTASGTAAQGNDSRFANLGHYPASGYGGVALSGDPMLWQNNSPFGNNNIAYSRIFIPAGKAITAVWAAIRTGGTHDGANNGNRLGIYDDTGAQVDLTAVDETVWTAAGWRGGNLAGGAIAAQSTDRFVYALALIRGITVTFAFPASANDNNAPFATRGPTETKRRGGYATGQSSMPASFDVTNFGTPSGFTPCFLLT